MRMKEAGPRVRETALLFGADKSLVGVISDPPTATGAVAASSAGNDAPALVLLNAGLLHRVGPNRLYVKLARRLAAAGFVVARFDLSGVGDSAAAGERSDFGERAVAETRACMDLLASSRGVQRFVVGGLCSGADNALLVAGQDERVAGLALLEPVSAPSAGQVLHSYRDRLRSPKSWLRLLTGRSEAWSRLGEMLPRRRRPAVSAPPKERSESAASAPVAARSAPPPVDLPGPQMRRFTERGGRLCLVYSADNPAHYHYRTVLRRDLEGAHPERLRVEVVPATDHVFTPLEAQARVVDVLGEWMKDLRG
jgi:pimeloyl-ACP methyl ester carboxylesterase